jgi:hypothetical protein
MFYLWYVVTQAPWHLSHGDALRSQTARDVMASHDTLVKLFERIQFFLQRLAIYTEISLTTEMIELLGKIMGELLSILALSTKQMDSRPQKRFSKWL